jgi:hypothetical protein
MRIPYRLLLLAVCVVAGLSGCATRYVQGNPSTVNSDEMIGDVVISEAAAEYESSPPVCLGLMPFTPVGGHFLLLRMFAKLFMRILRQQVSD